VAAILDSAVTRWFDIEASPATVVNRKQQVAGARMSGRDFGAAAALAN
jgi:hypothetical protein